MELWKFDFHNSHVQWSTAQTLKQSIERAKKFGYSVAFTGTLSDIDTVEEVKRAGFKF